MDPYSKSRLHGLQRPNAAEPLEPALRIRLMEMPIGFDRDTGQLRLSGPIVGTEAHAETRLVAIYKGDSRDILKQIGPRSSKDSLSWPGNHDRAAEVLRRTDSGNGGAEAVREARAGL